MEINRNYRKNYVLKIKFKKRIIERFLQSLVKTNALFVVKLYKFGGCLINLNILININLVVRLTYKYNCFVFYV